MKIGRYIVGLLSGLTFGMLFAPKKGKKLRTELFQKGSKSGQDALSVLANAFRDAGMDAVDEMKKIAENEQLAAALSMSKEKMREYLSQLEETGYDVAARAQEKMEELQDMAEETASSFKKRAMTKKRAVVRTVKKASKTAKKEVKQVVKKSTSKKSPVRKTAGKTAVKAKAVSKAKTAKKKTPAKKK